MTRPVYERCEPFCEEKGACQHPSGCLADAEKDIWNEAIEAAIEPVAEFEKACREQSDNEPIEYAILWKGMAVSMKEMQQAIRALKRQ